MLAVLFTLTVTVCLIQAAAEQTPTGWHWPAGTDYNGNWSGFMDWNPNWNGWHLAQDFLLSQGSPVYAIANGEIVLSRTDVGGYGVGGTEGGALVARFQTSTGKYFAALYGHLDRLHTVGKVYSGQILGYTNAYDHLHFGIHPGYELADNPWMGYSHVEGETYGWVDPMQFLLNNRPTGASPTPTLKPAPSQTPTLEPTPTPIFTPTPSSTSPFVPTPTYASQPTTNPSPNATPAPSQSTAENRVLSEVFIGTAAAGIVSASVVFFWTFNKLKQQKEIR